MVHSSQLECEEAKISSANLKSGEGESEEGVKRGEPKKNRDSEDGPMNSAIRPILRPTTALQTQEFRLSPVGTGAFECRVAKWWGMEGQSLVITTASAVVFLHPIICELSDLLLVP